METISQIVDSIQDLRQQVIDNKGYDWYINTTLPYQWNTVLTINRMAIAGTIKDDLARQELSTIRCEFDVVVN